MQHANGNTSSTIFCDVYYIPDLNTNLLSVTITPNCSKLKIADIGNVYALPDLALMLNEYVAHHVESTTFNSTLQMFDEITVWYKFCIQQYSTCRLFVIMPSQVVQAQPLSFDFPLGNCDAVLLNVDGQIHVAEVWAVFQLICSCHSQDLLPDFLSQPLLYIQPFHVITTPDSQLGTCLWMLERVYSPSLPQAPACHIGLIIPLTEVTHLADLVPVFREKVDTLILTLPRRSLIHCVHLSRHSCTVKIHSFSGIWSAIVQCGSIHNLHPFAKRLTVMHVT
ncbi:hypothetical protein EDC04DRAFT_2574545 [Pisolithus marmoratus]|nr:hypothetical protein EDC04DRAFT_2574545 [Pisolithus marmoratus]